MKSGGHEHTSTGVASTEVLQLQVTQNYPGLLKQKLENREKNLLEEFRMDHRIQRKSYRSSFL